MPRTLSPSQRTPTKVTTALSGVSKTWELAAALLPIDAVSCAAEKRLCVSTASIGMTFLVHRRGRRRPLLSQMNLRDAQLGELCGAGAGRGFKLASTN